MSFGRSSGRSQRRSRPRDGTVRATTFVCASTIVERIRSTVALGDRAAHLDALSRSEYQKVPDYELAQAIAKGVEAWHEVPSISLWCRERPMGAVRRFADLDREEFLDVAERWIADRWGVQSNPYEAWGDN